MTASCVEYFITDPCEGVECSANSACVASDTSYTCECDDGYTANGDECVVLVNECLAGTDECDSNAFCTDTPLGYGCVCDDGFDGDGFTCSIVCFDGTESNAAGTECVDINECAASNACTKWRLSVVQSSSCYEQHHSSIKATAASVTRTPLLEYAPNGTVLK